MMNADKLTKTKKEKKRKKKHVGQIGSYRRMIAVQTGVEFGVVESRL